MSPASTYWCTLAALGLFVHYFHFNNASFFVFGRSLFAFRVAACSYDNTYIRTSAVDLFDAPSGTARCFCTAYFCAIVFFHFEFTLYGGLCDAVAMSDATFYFQHFYITHQLAASLTRLHFESF